MTNTTHLGVVATFDGCYVEQRMITEGGPSRNLFSVFDNTGLLLANNLPTIAEARAFCDGYDIGRESE